ncbi:MAG TPA: MBL fold metallo-hydrolase [Rhizomicrobium sp.]|jgi:glyoxylase-like metal-dependent hydrolase (beta-lactamase superfamily II)
MMRPSKFGFCLLALLPGTAFAQQPANDHLLSPGNLSQVAPHSWVIRGFPNIGIVVGSKATLVIDTGMGTKNGQIVAAVAQRLSTNGQKLYLTTTHYHAEHAAGDGGFPPGTVVIRPQVQQAELEAEGQKLIDFFASRSPQDRELLADARIRKADTVFDREYRLDLGGGVTVRLMWFGAAHTKGDELILTEPDGVLFSGDVVQNKAGPYFYCDACTPKSWLAVMDHVAALHPRLVVPDHSAPGDESLITQEREMMSLLQTRIAALKSSGQTPAQATETLTAEVHEKYPDWTGFNHLDQAVARGYAEP